MAASGPASLQALLDDLPRAHPALMRQAVAALPGSVEEKTSELLALLARQQDELARAYVAAGLLYLGHPSGKASFLDGLRGDHPGWRELSLQQLPEVRGPARAGEAKFRVPDEEVLAAAAPLLADPESSAGARVLAFALQSRPALVAPHVAHLLRHPQLRIQDEVLKAMLGRGQDFGALQLLEEELLEPGLSAHRDSEPWRSFRWSQCALLPACARNTSDPALARRVGQLVLRVLDETLAAPDRDRRLNHSLAESTGAGWLDARHLLAAIVQTRPAGTQALLERVLRDPQLPIRLRSYALIAQAQLGGRPVPQAAEVVAEMFRSPPGGQDEDRVALLLQHGLIDPEGIAAEMPRQGQEEGWFGVLVDTLGQRAGGQDDRRIAAALVPVLQPLAPAADFRLLRLTGLLHALPRGKQQDAAIVQSLRAALAASGKAVDEARRKIDVLRELQRYGALDEAACREAVLALEPAKAAAPVPEPEPVAAPAAAQAKRPWWMFWKFW